MPKIFEITRYERTAKKFFIEAIDKKEAQSIMEEHDRFDAGVEVIAASYNIKRLRRLSVANGHPIYTKDGFIDAKGNRSVTK